eukprot:2205511-Pleurochrysis_carterae.AAC.1
MQERQTHSCASALGGVSSRTHTRAPAHAPRRFVAGCACLPARAHAPLGDGGDWGLPGAGYGGHETGKKRRRHFALDTRSAAATAAHLRWGGRFERGTGDWQAAGRFGSWRRCGEGWKGAERSDNVLETELS